MAGSLCAPRRPVSRFAVAVRGRGAVGEIQRIRPHVIARVAPGTSGKSDGVDAVADHGRIPDDSIHGTYNQSRDALGELAAIGIDYHNVVQVLEDQGVGAFKASWDQLGQRLATALHSEPATGPR